MAQFDIMISFSLIFNLLLVLYIYYAYNITEVLPSSVETKKFRNKISTELKNSNNNDISFKKLARGFHSTRENGDSENQKTIKTILFDMFLKYQFTVCTEPNIPSSHYIPLSLLTCAFGSLYYIVLYGLSISYILLTVYISDKFPDSFGSRYLSFLKRYSSPEAFKKYCGNPFSALKAAIKNPEFIKVVVKNGGSKIIVGAGVGLAAEHTAHKLKLGQIYEYQADKFLNNDKHSSGQPFSFKPNGSSLLEKSLQKKS
jgi:hypothetical protein